MAVEAAHLLAVVESDVSGLVTGLKQADTAVDKFANDTSKSLDKVDRSSQSVVKSTGKTTSALTGLNQGLGMLGLSVGAGTLVTLGLHAGQASNSLARTDATVKSLSQSSERYTEVVRLAREQQALFGGSLDKNLSAMSGLIPLSRTMGVELEALNKAALQLGSSNMAEGVTGAMFSIREFLTGTGAESTLSLADRFNLPKQALIEIKAASGDATEQVAALTELLNQQGFTMETVAAGTKTTGQAYTDLGVAISELRDDAGGVLARAFEGPARQAAGFLNIFQDLRGGLDQYTAASLRAAGHSEEQIAITQGQIRVAANLVLAERDKAASLLRLIGILPEVAEETYKAKNATEEYVTYLQRAPEAITAYQAALARNREKAQINESTDAYRQFYEAVGQSAYQQALAANRSAAAIRDTTTAYRAFYDTVARGTQQMSASDRFDRWGESISMIERQTLPAYRAEVARTSDALDEARKAHDEARASVTSIQGELDSAKAAWQSYADAQLVGTRAFADQLFAIEQQRAQVQLDLLRFEAPGSGLDQILAPIQQQIETVTASLGGYEAAVTRAAAAVDAQKTTVADATAILDDWDRAVTRDQATVRGHEERLSDLKGQYDTLKNSIKSNEDALESWRNAQLIGTAAFDSQLGRLDTQAQRLQLQLANMKLSGAPEASMRALEQQLERVRNQSERVSLRESLQLDPLREQIERFGKETREFSFDEIIAGMKGAQENIDDLRGKLGPAETAIRNETAALKDAQAQLKETESARDAQRIVVENEKAALDNLQLSLQGAEGAYGRQKQELAELQTQLDTTRTEALQPFQDQLDTLAAHAAEVALIEKLQLAPLQREIENLITPTRELTFQEIVTGLTNTNTQINVLQGRLTEAQSILVTHEGMAKAAEDHYNKAQEALTVQQEYFDALRTGLDDLRLNLDGTKTMYGDVIALQRELLKNQGVISVPGSPSTAAPGARTRGSVGTGNDPILTDRAIDQILPGGRQSDTWSGWRDYNNNRRREINEIHAGVDLAGAAGMNVRTPKGGEVVFAGPNEWGGSAVIIRQGGEDWYFGHLRGDIDVAKGMDVDAGQVIGQIDPTYRHTHVQLTRGGQLVDPTATLEALANPTGMGPGLAAMAADAVAGTDSAAAWAASAQQILGVIETGVFALEQLADYKGITRDAVLLFTNDLKGFVETFRVVVQDFDREGMASALQWSQAAASILGVIGEGVFSLSLLKKHKGITRDSVLQFGHDLYGTVTTLAVIVRDFDRDGMKAAEDWVGSAGTVLSIVDMGVQTLTSISKYKGITRDAVLQFGHDLYGTVTTLNVIVRDFDREAIEAANEWVIAASGVLSIVGIGIDALTGLRKYKGIAPGAVELFGEDIRSVTSHLISISNTFDPEAVEAAAQFAAGAGHIVSIIGGGIDHFTALRAYEGVPDHLIFVFMQDLSNAVRRMDYLSGQWEQEAVDAASRFAESVAPIVGIIGAGVEGFTALRSYRGVTDMHLYMFFRDVTDTVRRMAYMAGQFEEEGVEAAALFADSAGRIIAPIATAVEAFSAVNEYEGIKPEHFKLLASDMTGVIGHMSALAQYADQEGAAAAAQLASSTDVIVGSIGSSLDAFAGINEYEGLNKDKLHQLLADTQTTMQEVSRVSESIGATSGFAFVDAWWQKQLELQPEFTENMQTWFRDIDDQVIRPRLDAMVDIFDITGREMANAMGNGMSAATVDVVNAAAAMGDAAGKAARAAYYAALGTLDVEGFGMVGLGAWVGDT